MNKHFKFPFFGQDFEQAVDEFIKTVHTENTKDLGWAWTRPLANIEEHTDKYVIHLAAPGLVKSDFKISLDQNILKVEVDKVKPENDIKKIKTEYSYHKFTRNFKVSDDVNKDGINGSYDQGILTITLTKHADGNKGNKTINVN